MFHPSWFCTGNIKPYSLLFPNVSISNITLVLFVMVYTSSSAVNILFFVVFCLWLTVIKYIT